MTIINYAKLGLRHKDEPTRDKALDKILAAAQRAEKSPTACSAWPGIARKNLPPRTSQLIDESLVLLEREMQKYRVAVRCEFAEVPPVRCHWQSDSASAAEHDDQRRGRRMPQGGELLIRLTHDAASNPSTLRSAIPARAFLPRACPRFSTATTPPRAVPTKPAKVARAWASPRARKSSTPIKAASASKAASAAARHSSSACRCISKSSLQHCRYRNSAYHHRRKRYNK